MAAGCSIGRDAFNVPKGYLLSIYRLFPRTYSRNPRTASTSAVAWSWHDVRNAVTMRSHIIPVMVPFEYTITDAVDISPELVSSIT